MRIAGLPFFALAFLITPHCHAAQKFSCGGAEVRIEVVARNSPAWEDRSEAVITVFRDGAETVLRYRYAEFIGGQCFATSNAQSLVIFQAFCGGSGCKDLDNWGVIDPRTLRVLIVPNDWNRDETRKLIGGGVLPHLQMMSVSSEACKLGIDIPKSACGSDNR